MKIQLDEIPEAIRLLNITYPESEVTFTVSLRADTLGDYIYVKVLDSTGRSDSSGDSGSPLAHVNEVIKNHGPSLSRTTLLRKEIEAKEKDIEIQRQELENLKKQADPLLLAMDKVLEKGGV